MGKKPIQRDLDLEKQTDGRHKAVIRYDVEVPVETESFPASSKPGTVHVELYLKAKGVKIWERGGKVAFAKSHGLEFGSDNEFDSLFTSY